MAGGVLYIMWSAVMLFDVSYQALLDSTLFEKEFQGQIRL